MKFSIKDFCNKCNQIRSPVDLVTFTEEILNGKLHFCAVNTTVDIYLLVENVSYNTVTYYQMY